MLDTIKEARLVPVVKVQDSSQAIPLMEALLEGGLPVCEITFRTEAAADAINLVAKKFPDVLLGAGTVTKTEQVDKAIDAGASFLVSPGFNPKIVEYALKKNILIVPGTNAPSFVEQAMDMGLELLKFFPAEASGGIPMLKSMGAVYPATFIPTGGIGPKNFADYLALDNVLACGGSWIVKPEWINNGDWASITRATKEALA